jgi:excisionase family DNA binding protein
MVDTYLCQNGNGFCGPCEEAPLSTVADVARRLHSHPHPVRRWADSGLLRCYRIDFRRDCRFKQDDVEAFLRANTREHYAEYPDIAVKMKGP